MPHRRKHQTVRDSSSRNSHDHHGLRRKARSPIPLSTLYRIAPAPQPRINTSNVGTEASASISSSVVLDARFKPHPISSPIWPPDGFTNRSYLTPEEAEDLICQGVLCLQGHAYKAAHTTQACSDYYAFCGIARGDDLVLHPPKCPYGFQGFSLVLGHHPDPSRPWETLEQPSMTLCFGRIPGSITINQYVGSEGDFSEDTHGAASVSCREMKTRDVLDRLDCLQHGLEDDATFAQEYLCRTLVFCSETEFKDAANTKDQIRVLATALDCPRWFDFGQTDFQTIATYFSKNDQMIVHIFYHQLMLSLQLLRTIQSLGLEPAQQDVLFEGIPEKVAWSIALAQLWKKHCFVTKAAWGVYHSITEPYVMKPRKQSRLDQLERLRQFGSFLKWPRMSHVEKAIEDDRSGTIYLDTSCKEMATYLSGLIMPGSCLSWMIMASLINCDKEAGRRLRAFQLFRPDFGFQYRNVSYWYWECIVAKVMAAARGVKQSTGWVGPVSYTANLSQTQCALINVYAAPRRLSSIDVVNMEKRSDPLGPDSDDYPVKDFSLPSLNTSKIDTINFQRLEFKPLRIDKKSKATIYDSAATFEVKTGRLRTIPIRMRYDVDFIDVATPCRSGPHLLFHGYDYESTPVDELVDLEFWGGQCVCRLDEEECAHRTKHRKLFEKEKVLVIKTFGKDDNKVFARAWCSFMGLNAMVCKEEETCVACAVRAAYAAKVYVVIVS